LLCAAAFAKDLLTLLRLRRIVQTPGLILLPNLPVSTVIGTIKIPAFSGTSFAAYQYLKDDGLEIITHNELLVALPLSGLRTCL
jgi:uncharacterized membrane protein YfcA